MLIAIDYDNTYTEDVAFWSQFINLVSQYNHQIICVTNREHSKSNKKNMKIPPNIPILFAGNCPKKQFAESYGFKVDIWIDDSPDSV